MVSLPFKIKITSIDIDNDGYYGEIEFHGKKYKLRIRPSDAKNEISIPFKVIGIKDQNPLVRVSGINGIYSQDNLRNTTEHDFLEIKSSLISEEIVKKYMMLDTIEIFFK